MLAQIIQIVIHFIFRDIRHPKSPPPPPNSCRRQKRLRTNPLKVNSIFFTATKIVINYNRYHRRVLITRKWKWFKEQMGKLCLLQIIAKNKDIYRYLFCILFPTNHHCLRGTFILLNQFSQYTFHLECRTNLIISDNCACIISYTNNPLLSTPNKNDYLFHEIESPVQHACKSSLDQI